MNEQHECEWKYTRDRTHPFICHKCFPTEALSITEAEHRLNEYETLKRENKAQEAGIIRALQTPIGAVLTQDVRLVLTDALKAGGR